HEQQGEQLAPAGHVAVDGRGDHPQFPGHLAQGQPGHTVGLELGAGDLEDALHGLLARLLASGRPGAHDPILAHSESTALAFEARAVFTAWESGALGVDGAPASPTSTPPRRLHLDLDFAAGSSTSRPHPVGPAPSARSPRPPPVRPIPRPHPPSEPPPRHPTTPTPRRRHSSTAPSRRPRPPGK